ncbi:DUF4037 domain-containing protein [Eubacterium barkeri]|uniref:DUF4037 domain-containing protein n=1 Tax=Eubacterium barkeri TaxID=1528 RepID=A0A1H3APC7_EUBBA|nr:DUF4037 domain-containing protein [Eubacterium barkeri]SDX31552.1 protein of unknown function [Eubacterium barkeri]
MKGLELSRYYFEALGKERIKKRFPELYPRLAFGLAGEGSECFGFDDAYSMDHDWGPGFCIWMTEADYQAEGQPLQALYESLPPSIGGYPPRQDSGHGSHRVGVQSIPRWFTRYTGMPAGPTTLREWLSVPDSFLATATNGAVFKDHLGTFSEIRHHLMADYPEDVRLRRLADGIAGMAQSGQYNYPRCLARGEIVAAQMAFSAFIQSGLSVVYLLNRRYAPFYKWRHRGLEACPVLPRAQQLFTRLVKAGDDARRECIEGICLTVVGELRRQGLTDGDDSFLDNHRLDILRRIQDDTLRQRSVMEVTG